MQNPQRPLLVAAIGAPCAYCSAPMMPPDKPPTRDHVKPRAKGGTFADQRNRLLVCSPCNHAKGKRTLQQWLRVLVAASDPRAARVGALLAENKSAANGNEPVAR